MATNTSKVSQELLDEMADDVKTSGGSRQNQFKVTESPEGHRIRVLPGTFGKLKKKWYVPLTQHWGPSPNSSFNTSYACPKEHFGKDCPFCDKWAEVKEKIREIEGQLEEQQDKKIRNRLKAELKSLENIAKGTSYRKTYALNIVDRADRTLQNKVFYAPKTIWDVLIGAFINNAADGDIFDVWDGNDIKIIRKTENKRTSYNTSLVMRQSEIHNDEAEVKRLLKGRIDLEAIIEMPKMSDLQKSLQKLIDAADNEDLPTSGKDDFAAPRGGASRPADDDDDELPGVRGSRKPTDEELPPRKNTRPALDEEEDEVLPPRKNRSEESSGRSGRSLDESEETKTSTRKKVLDEEDEDIVLPTRPTRRVVDLDEDEETESAAKPSGADNDETLSKFKNIVDENENEAE